MMVHSQGKMRKPIQDKKPPEIIVQNFDEDMFDLGTPKDVEHLCKFVLSPRQSQATASRWNNGLADKLHIPYDTNSCVLLSPSFQSRSETDNWEDIFQANGAEELLNGPEKKLTDSFLTELGLKSPHSKVTLFSPKCPDHLFSENFLKEIGLDHGEVTLLTPKAANLISTKTPVVVKRQNEGKCELGIYLPPCYTPALVDSIRSTINEEDLTMFPFPPVSANSTSNSSLEDTDDTEKSIRNTSSFFNCMPLGKQVADDSYNNNNIVNINNNNNMFTHPVPCSVIQDGGMLQDGGLIQDGRLIEDDRLIQESNLLVNCRLRAQNVAVSRNTTRRNRANHRLDYKSNGVERKEEKRKTNKCNELRKHFKEARVLHNDVERKRRSEMHSKFQKLRESIPEVETDKKAAKITILKVAKRYIKELEEEAKRIEQIKEYEKSRNRDLLNRLCTLTGTTGCQT